MAKRRTLEELERDAERALAEARSRRAMKELAQEPLGQTFLQAMRKLRKAAHQPGDEALSAVAQDCYERMAKGLEKRYGIVQPQDSDEPDLPFEEPEPKEAGAA